MSDVPPSIPARSTEAGRSPGALIWTVVTWCVAALVLTIAFGATLLSSRYRFNDVLTTGATIDWLLSFLLPNVFVGVLCSLVKRLRSLQVIASLIALANLVSTFVAFVRGLSALPH